MSGPPKGALCFSCNAGHADKWCVPMCCFCHALLPRSCVALESLTPHGLMQCNASSAMLGGMPALLRQRSS